MPAAPPNMKSADSYAGAERPDLSKAICKIARRAQTPGPSGCPRRNVISFIDENGAYRWVGHQLSETYLKSAVWQRDGQKWVCGTILSLLANIEKLSRRHPQAIS
jgi:hypothetical protein